MGSVGHTSWNQVGNGTGAVCLEVVPRVADAAVLCELIWGRAVGQGGGHARGLGGVSEDVSTGALIANSYFCLQNAVGNIVLSTSVT